jgi:hypothetical protein
MVFACLLLPPGFLNQAAVQRMCNPGTGPDPVEFFRGQPVDLSITKQKQTVNSMPILGTPPSNP